MQIAVGIVCVSSVLVLAANAQEWPPLIRQEPVLLQSEERQVRRLTLTAGNLPATTRKNIEHELRGKICIAGEIQERIRQGLRDAGYANALVDEPQVAVLDGSSTFTLCDVFVHASPGGQYRLDTIRFTTMKGKTAIPEDQLRREFAIQRRGLFNATEVGKGLERERDLYLSKGYIDVGMIPKLTVDESHRTIVLTIDIDEGRPRDFGRLLLDGPEPYAGVAKALLAAWTLEGRRYNPELLSKWVDLNAPFLRKHDGALWQYAAPRFNWVTQRVDIQLELPWPDP